LTPSAKKRRQGKAKKASQGKIFSWLLILTLNAFILNVNLRFPKEITLYEGESFAVEAAPPLAMAAAAGQAGVLAEDGGLTRDAFADSGGLFAREAGAYTVELKLFDWIPIRAMRVNVAPQKEIIPCGYAGGVKILSKGLLVVGVQETAD
jgi:hypothetical protein